MSGLNTTLSVRLVLEVPSRGVDDVLQAVVAARGKLVSHESLDPRIRVSLGGGVQMRVRVPELKSPEVSEKPRRESGKLTPEKIVSIYADKRLARVIAEEYGINTQTVYNIRKLSLPKYVAAVEGVTRPEGAPAPRLRKGSRKQRHWASATQVVGVFRARGPQAEIARRFNIHPSMVSRIKSVSARRYRLILEEKGLLVPSHGKADGGESLIKIDSDQD